MHRGEVASYNRYLTGEVYTYRISKQESCSHCHSITNEDFEACGGWDSIDDAMKEAMQVVDYQSAQVSA